MEQEPNARLPLPIKLTYGFGSIAEGIKDAAFKTFLLFYYNQVLGLPGWMGGAAAAVALLVDAITDPLVGSLSDSTRSRWGRRHPFMYAAPIPMAVAFYLLFNPPADLSHAGLCAWLTGFSVLVRTSMTLYSIPSNSLVPELTPHYDERTSLVSFRYLFGWIGGGSMVLLAYLWFLAGGGTLADGLRDPSGYAAWSLTGSIGIVVAILTCTLGTHHLIPRLAKPSRTSRFTLRRLRTEVREALDNRSYRALIVAALFASVGGAFTDVFGIYLNTYFWEFTPAQMAAFVPGVVVGVVLGASLARPLSVRLDKRNAALSLAILSVALGPLPIFLKLGGLTPPNGSPQLLTALVIHAACMVMFAVAIGILIGSMISDTIDESELATGKRQEGIFASAIAFSAKAATGFGTLLAGISLDLIAFPRPIPGEPPPPIPVEQAMTLGWIVGPGLLGLWACTLYFLSRYRLTRADHARIRGLLALRRNGSSPNGGSD